MTKIESLKGQPVEVVALIKRVSGALELFADGIDELTDLGNKDLEGHAALGFAYAIRTCALDLEKLTPTAAAKKEGA